MKNVNQTIVETFREVAEYLETGRSGRRPRLLLTGMGSEHGEENSMQAAVMAARVGLDVSYIGTLEGEGVTTVPVADEEAGHRKMVELLESGAADAAVTMHFPFPIGVSTVGRVVTPARGKSMFLATTTGTSSANRLEGMILNAIYGIITAKACGIQEPTVGILNVDGARACETALRQLQQAGYPIRFAESVRADGGAVMRGNDVLQGTPDVMVCDSLTGNVLIKMLSSFTTGGSFESTGYGYGPGIGRDYDKLVLIISRASGAPLIANALSFADELVRGGVQKIAKAEFALADKAGLEELLRQKREASAPAAAKAEVKAPAKEPCTAGIPGIEVMDIEAAVQVLWAKDIYAESAMGCTGPLVLVSDANEEKAKTLLAESGFDTATPLRIVLNGNAIRKSIAQIMQGYLAQIGITVEINSYEDSLFNTYKSDETAYDILLDNCGGSDYLMTIWRGKFDANAYSTGGTINGVYDDKLQSLMEACEKDNSKANMDAFQDCLYSHAYAVGLFNAQMYTVCRDSVKSISMDGKQFPCVASCTYSWN